MGNVTEGLEWQRSQRSGLLLHLMLFSFFGLASSSSWWPSDLVPELPRSTSVLPCLVSLEATSSHGSNPTSVPRCSPASSTRRAVPLSVHQLCCGPIRSSVSASWKEVSRVSCVASGFGGCTSSCVFVSVVLLSCLWCPAASLLLCWPSGVLGCWLKGTLH